MQAIHGNPQYRPQLAQTDSTSPITQPQHGKPGRIDGSARMTVDQVDLSPEAQQYLENSGPGKPGHSTAQMARNAIADHPELGGMPFGEVVSAINHGTVESLFAPATTEVPEGEVIDPATGDEVVDGTDVAATGTESTEGTTEAESTAGTSATDAVEGEIPAATDPVEEILETETAEGDIPVATDPDAEILTTADSEDTAVEEDTVTVAPPTVEQTDTDAALLDLIDGTDDESETDSTEQTV